MTLRRTCSRPKKPGRVAARVAMDSAPCAPTPTLPRLRRGREGRGAHDSLPRRRRGRAGGGACRSDRAAIASAALQQPLDLALGLGERPLARAAAQQTDLHLGIELLLDLPV